MEALKYMRVDLVACADRPEPYSHFEDVLFAPLKKIQGLQQFDVFLSWEEGETVREEGVQPFTIKRTMEHVRCSMNTPGPCGALDGHIEQLPG